MSQCRLDKVITGEHVIAALNKIGEQFSLQKQEDGKQQFRTKRYSASISMYRNGTVLIQGKDAHALQDAICQAHRGEACTQSQSAPATQTGPNLQHSGSAYGSSNGAPAAQFMTNLPNAGNSCGVCSSALPPQSNSALPPQITSSLPIPGMPCRVLLHSSSESTQTANQPQVAANLSSTDMLFGVPPYALSSPRTQTAKQEQAQAAASSLPSVGISCGVPPCDTISSPIQLQLPKQNASKSNSPRKMKWQDFCARRGITRNPLITGKPDDAIASGPVGADEWLLYTDGACPSNRNVRSSKCPAGWGVVVLEPGSHRLLGELFGPVILDQTSSYFLGADVCSNNTGELSAMGEALRWIRDELPRNADGSRPPVRIRFDSTYAAYIAIGKFRAHTNVELARRVKELWKEVSQLGTVTVQHVKGHSKEVWNDKADALANKGAQGLLSRNALNMTGSQPMQRIRSLELGQAAVTHVAAASAPKRRRLSTNDSGSSSSGPKIDRSAGPTLRGGKPELPFALVSATPKKLHSSTIASASNSSSANGMSSSNSQNEEILDILSGSKVDHSGKGNSQNDEILDIPSGSKVDHSGKGKLESSWSCSTCSFANNFHMLYCEMCEEPKVVPGCSERTSGEKLTTRTIQPPFHTEPAVAQMVISSEEETDSMPRLSRFRIQLEEVVLS